MRVHHEIYGPGTYVGPSQFPEFIIVRFDKPTGLRVQRLTVGDVACTPLDEPDAPRAAILDLDLDLNL